jgi:hypothetical protein
MGSRRSRFKNPSISPEPVQKLYVVDTLRPGRMFAEMNNTELLAGLADLADFADSI